MIYQLLVPGPVKDVEEVRILEWHGAPGTPFAPGEMVVELETHKAVVEVRAGQNSHLRRILCNEGAWQKIGAPLAIFSDSPDERIPETPDELTALAVSFAVI
ncbi:MAG TPA: lipoyl domain-containing protein [Xanthobacteraceae bacterium]|jgi:pyruvate/2-oxoglutarate dehydrogenase complex dihydrolipoamide acyltransferase (E2) component